MDQTKFLKIAQEIANDENLQNNLKNAPSKEASYEMLKNIPGGCSKKEAEEFFNEAYNLGSARKLTEEQLAEVTGGLSVRNFMMTCIVGIFGLCILGPVTGHMNTASAYDSGGAPVSYAGGTSIPNRLIDGSDAEQQASTTDKMYQAAHERITVTSYAWSVGADSPRAMNRGFKNSDVEEDLKKIPKKQTSAPILADENDSTESQKEVSTDKTETDMRKDAAKAVDFDAKEKTGIPDGLEQGSYWNDMCTESYSQFLASFKHREDNIASFEGEYDGDANREAEHLLITMAKSTDDYEDRTKFTHNNRGNYVHCMQMHEPDDKPSTQNNTYQCTVKWTEFGVAFAVVGSCENISVEVSKKIVKATEETAEIKDILDRVGISDFVAAKCVLSNPALKVKMMSDADIAKYVKEKYKKGGSWDSEFLTYINKAMSKIDKKDEGKLKDKNKAGILLLAEKLMVDDIINSADALKVSDEEILKALAKKADDLCNIKGKQSDAMFLQNRTGGMVSHTIEDSFNPAHCDRYMNYELKDGEMVLSYGGIKSFMDYEVQHNNHKLFDKISEEDFLKNLVGSPANLAEIKTAGLKQVVEKLTTFYGMLYGGKDGSERKSVVEIMKWMSKNVIHFDEHIAEVVGYEPYKNLGELRLKTGATIVDGHGTLKEVQVDKSYDDFLTTPGGSLVSSVTCSTDDKYKENDLFLKTEGLVETSKLVINDIKLLLNAEREAVLRQDFARANLCARFIKSAITLTEDKNIQIKIGDKEAKFGNNLNIFKDLLLLYNDYQFGKTLCEDDASIELEDRERFLKVEGEKRVLSVNHDNIFILACESKFRNRLKGTAYANYRLATIEKFTDKGDMAKYFKERLLFRVRLEERALYNYTTKEDSILREYMKQRTENVFKVQEKIATTDANGTNQKIEEARAYLEREAGMLNTAQNWVKGEWDALLKKLTYPVIEQPAEMRKIASGWGKYNENMCVGENGYAVRSYDGLSKAKDTESLKKLQDADAALECVLWSKVAGTGAETTNFLTCRRAITEAIKDGKKVPTLFNKETSVQEFFQGKRKELWKKYDDKAEELFKNFGIVSDADGIVVMDWERFVDFIKESLDMYFPDGRVHTIDTYTLVSWMDNIDKPKDKDLNEAVKWLKGDEGFAHSYRSRWPGSPIDFQFDAARKILFTLGYISEQLCSDENSGDANKKELVRQVLGGGKTIARCFTKAMRILGDDWTKNKKEKNEEKLQEVSNAMLNVLTRIELTKYLVNSDKISEGSGNSEAPSEKKANTLVSEIPSQKTSADLKLPLQQLTPQAFIQFIFANPTKNSMDEFDELKKSWDIAISEAGVPEGFNIQEYVKDDYEPIVDGAGAATAAAATASDEGLDGLKEDLKKLINKCDGITEQKKGVIELLDGTDESDSRIQNIKKELIEIIKKIKERAENIQGAGERGDAASKILSEIESFVVENVELPVSVSAVGACLVFMLERTSADGIVQGYVKSQFDNNVIRVSLVEMKIKKYFEYLKTSVGLQVFMQHLKKEEQPPKLEFDALKVMSKGLEFIKHVKDNPDGDYEGLFNEINSIPYPEFKLDRSEI